MTTGPGDSRTLGGAPLFGDAAKSATTGRSTLEPGGSRPEQGTASAEGTRPAAAGRPPASHDASAYLAPPAATTAGGAAARPMTVGTAAMTRKKGRRARLTITRLDPWSTLKFSFVYSLAGLVVLLVAVIVLYGVVDALGVISSLRSFLGDVSDTSSGPGLAAWLGFGRVMLVTIIVGLVNVVLFTALATLTAFIYNVCTDIVGGVEVTLAERN